MDREYLKRVLLYVVVSLVAIGAMIYVGFHMVKSFTSEVETTPAYIDSFAESVTFDAYILRRERVITSYSEGTVNYLVGDGEKVAVGADIADICRGGSEGIRERVSAIDERIKTLRSIESSAAYSSTSDASNVEARIRELLCAVNESVAANELSSAAFSANEMMAQLNKHAIITGKIDGFGKQIEALEEERARLISQLTDVSETVVSSESAYFFYDVDGYEAAFAYDDIDTVGIDDIFAMASAAAAAPDAHAVGKYVLDHKWYVAVPTTREEAVFFREGGDYDVTFNAGGKKLRMNLHSVISEAGGDGRAALIFECTDMPEDFEYTRMQTVTVTVNEYSGFRVPLSAVRVVNYGDDAVEGVYILYGGVVYFRRVEVILTQDGYALCDSTAGVVEEEKDEDDGEHVFPDITETTAPETEPPETEPPKEYESIPYLSLYDLVIISAKGLYDGKVVSG